MKYTSDFVLKVNEIYHDVENEEYQNKHPEIFLEEKARWDKIGLSVLNGSNPITLLDIGSGTGFVPLVLSKYLKPEDVLNCSDISIKMLEVCKLNLAEIVHCNLNFIKLDGKSIPVPDHYADVITMNSVLHHLPDFEIFFSEVDRILKPGGCLVIGHEPNKKFFSGRLWSNYKIIAFFFSPIMYWSSILKGKKITNQLLKIYKKINRSIGNHLSIVEKVNSILMKEKMVSKALTAAELSEIIDIQSPTAGGFHKEKGIDVTEVNEQYLKNYKIEYSETYLHLFRVKVLWLLKNYNKYLQKKYPDQGANFIVIYRKHL